MKTTFLTLLTIILSFELLAQQTKTETIYFDYDKYDLTSEATTVLEAFYNNIKTENFNSIKIIGHTDADGLDNYNLTLSQNRTKTVFDYFLSKGISKDKLQIQFFGENKPIAKNDNEQDKQQNRRVEIILEKNFYVSESFEKQAQSFSIPSNNDTTIICNEGTIIKIKANSFVSEKTGQLITERINFTVTEYYKLSDIVLSNLSTTSKGELLETAGMVNITATINNEPLKLKDTKTIEISFPTKKKENDMQLFSGTWSSNNQIDWSTQSSDEKNSDQIFIIVEQMPTFNAIGGNLRLFDYLSSNIKYPQKAKELGLQGTVYIAFVINKDGEVKDPRILRGVTPELDSAALDVIKQMPNWNPGKQNGNTVNVQLTIPVTFNLGDTSLVGKGSFKQRFEQSFTDTTIQTVSSENLIYYVLNSVDLGWINCDRFLNIYPKTNFVVKLDKEIESLKIIFDRYKSVMNVVPTNGNYIFKGVPSGEKITIVAVKRVDNKPYLSVKETKTSSRVENELIFQPVTMESLKTEMKKLDKLY